MKRKILIITSFLLVIISSSYAAAASNNIWGVRVGDKFQWNFYDTYYTINSYNTSSSLSNPRSYISDDYVISYENVKEWKSGDLTVNISSTRADIDRVSLNVTYLMLGGKQSVTRIYKNYDNEVIKTIIPAQIEVIANRLYREPYTLTYGKEVETVVNGSLFFAQDEDGNWQIPVAFKFGTMGSANITFYNSSGSLIFTYTYYFHYVNSQTAMTKSVVKTYESFGLSIEVINVTDYIMDNDDDPDLLVMTENSFSINTTLGSFGSSIPSYVDLTSATSLLPLLVNLLTKNSSIVIVAMPPIAFTLPSGMNVMYSDVAMTTSSLLDLAYDFTNDIISPLISGSVINLNHLFYKLSHEGVSIADVYDVMLLLSISNYLLLPSSMDLSKIGDAIDSIQQAVAETSSVTTPWEKAKLDLNSIAYTLSHAFSYDKSGSFTTIAISPTAIPLLYDSRNGMASIGARMTWNGTIMDRIEIEVDYISANFGHVIGMKRVTDGGVSGTGGSQTVSDDDAWYNKFTNWIIIFMSLLGGGGIAMIVNKKYHAKRDLPFKSVINGMRINDDCINGYCPDK